MGKVVLLVSVLAGASIGVIAGHVGEPPASAAAEDLSRSHRLLGEVELLRARFADVQRDLAAAQTPAAATAAGEKLFQLRVDMVALEDELAVLARRSPAAGD